MTTKLISTSYPSGYSLASKYSGLLILSSGYIGGGGLKLNSAANVGNYGVIAGYWRTSNANNGVTADAGATIRNGAPANHKGAYISGYSGIFAQNAAATVENYGTIDAFGPGGDGVFIVDGGSVTNGSASDTAAAIISQHSGVTAGALATVVNFGFIEVDAGSDYRFDGVDLAAGGTIVNGSAGVTTAHLIGAAAGVAAGALTGIQNYGTIEGGVGVSLALGGTVTNGSTASTSALIYAYGAGAAVGAYAGTATIVNFGAIKSKSADGVVMGGGAVTNGGTGVLGALIQGGYDAVVTRASAAITNFGALSGAHRGVDLYAGTLINGSAHDAAAEINGGVMGVFLSRSGTVTNFGDISGAANIGVELIGGGRVTNGAVGDTGAVISGGTAGVASGALATVSNFGTIQGFVFGGVDLARGTVINGSAAATTAEISGRQSGVDLVGGGTVTNFGEIKSSDSSGAYGVRLFGGLVVNGSATDTGANIAGYRGVLLSAAGTVLNYGTVQSIDDYSQVAIRVANGGVVVNGSATDTIASISGGIDLLGGGSLKNFGTVAGGSYSGDAVYTGGTVTFTNGSVADPIASITGGYGVVMKGAGTLRNFGTIAIGTDFAAKIYGGVLANGAAGDLTALIQGEDGVFTNACIVTNFATILGAYAQSGLYLYGGRLTNGSATITSSLIYGRGSGVATVHGASIANFATIAGGSGAGVALGDDCVLVNGSAGVAGPLVEGATGVSATGKSATIENFGAIYGSQGVAVDLSGVGDVLAVEAGCAFYGAVLGGGGTLDLDSGSGTISSFSHGDANISGAIVPAEFSNFDAFGIGAAANFTLLGAASLAAARTLTVDGSLTVAGTLSSAGTLAVTRTLTGAGTLALTGGSATFAAGTVLTIAKVAQSGGVASFTAASLTVSHPWTQSAGTVSVGAGDKASFTGAGDTLSGTLTGTGTIAFTAGSGLLSGATLSAKTLTINGAAVTLSGAISLSGALGVTSTNLAIATAGATLSGGGTLNLTNQASNAIRGAASTAILTNLDKITGAGTISGLVLVNQAGGIINGNQTAALAIATGANTITNAGLIENTGTGGTTLKSAVANTGTLTVNTGTLAVTGAVTGAGTVRISGGTADFAAFFSENVTFASTAGVLELARSASYTGKITGFSKTGATSLDLLDIAFGGSTTATFSGTTASGVLTVTDGTHTAKITLVGNYTASTFTPTSDGHGGTTIVDPTAAPIGRTPPMLPLVTAMAAMVKGPSGASEATPPIRGLVHPMLAAARHAAVD